MQKIEAHRRLELTKIKIPKSFIITATIATLGFVAFSAGLIDLSSEMDQLYKQADMPYPPSSPQEIESAKREIILFDQKNHKMIAGSGVDLFTTLSEEEKLKLRENTQLISQAEIRSNYIDKLDNRDPLRRGLDAILILAGGTALCVGFPISIFKVGSETKKHKRNIHRK